MSVRRKALVANCPSPLLSNVGVTDGINAPAARPAIVDTVPSVSILRTTELNPEHVPRISAT